MYVLQERMKLDDATESLSRCRVTERNGWDLWFSDVQNKRERRIKLNSAALAVRPQKPDQNDFNNARLAANFEGKRLNKSNSIYIIYVSSITFLFFSYPHCCELFVFARSHDINCFEFSKSRNVSSEYFHWALLSGINQKPAQIPPNSQEFRDNISYVEDAIATGELSIYVMQGGPRCHFIPYSFQLFFFLFHLKWIESWWIRSARGIMPPFGSRKSLSIYVYMAWVHLLRNICQFNRWIACQCTWTHTSMLAISSG